MPNRHSFGASNIEGTCLWCGRPLRRGSTERGLKRKLKRLPRLYAGLSLAREIAELMARHERLKDKIGAWHGCFCTDACAARFGFSAANNGFRLEPPKRRRAG